MPSSSSVWCEKHPAYAVKAAPTSACETCAYMWSRKHARRVCACKRVFVWRGDSGVKYCSPCCAYNSRIPVGPPAQQVEADRDKHRRDAEIASLRQRYDESLKTIDQKDRELRAMGLLGKNIETFKIKAQKASGAAEGTVVLLASDWHIEENVGAEVGGLNRYNLEIAHQRVQQFFSASLRLIKLLQQDCTISTAILALLGDFITNDIHEEFVETAEALPMDALVIAQNMIISGIEFLLANSELSLVIPCHSGNHARVTKKTHFSTENGHSLEYLMYLHLTAYFRNEFRVKFIVSEGYHSYVDVYDQTIRFHHGHAIKYQGGIGGIFIPAFKAIAQWNKARHADLDAFGHFHQLKDGGNFISNGSLIGYNAFALNIKADFEPPRQTLFLVDKKRRRTCTWPILVQS